MRSTSIKKIIAKSKPIVTYRYQHWRSQKFGFKCSLTFLSKNILIKLKLQYLQYMVVSAGGDADALNATVYQTKFDLLTQPMQRLSKPRIQLQRWYQKSKSQGLIYYDRLVRFSSRYIFFCLLTFLFLNFQFVEVYS